MQKRKVDTAIEKLKCMVLTTYFHGMRDENSCGLLSEDIFLRTRNYISKSTIEGLYGLRVTSRLTTPFVLNSLAQYCGYPNWDSYLDKT